MIGRRCPARTLLVGLFVVTALGSCRPVFNREVSGTVLAVEGVANGTIGGQTIGLTNGSSIKPGEKSQLRKRHADLMLLPGLLIELEGDTEIELMQL
jgi:hypothetical protein